MGAVKLAALGQAYGRSAVSREAGLQAGSPINTASSTKKKQYRCSVQVGSGVQDESRNQGGSGNVQPLGVQAGMAASRYTVGGTPAGRGPQCR
jgi:hypothetical protein